MLWTCLRLPARLASKLSAAARLQASTRLCYPRVASSVAQREWGPLAALSSAQVQFACRFVVVDHALEERRTPGNTLIVQPDKPYQVPFCSTLMSLTDPHCCCHPAASL